jgi:YebC/PmpR family DNA-binding regulatory protein
MSGHSHWATIKRKKGAADAKRGKQFSKCAKAIIVAARMGGGDPDMNLRLRYAIDDAKAVNMPNANIERAVKKGTGELDDGSQIEEILYEGYGPGGVAIFVEAMTDNRNRTSSEVGKIFERHGGNMGQPGCVAWMFSQKGVVTGPAGQDEETLMEAALAAGAEDLSVTEDGYEVYTPPDALQAVKEALEEAGVPVEAAEIAQVPQTYVSLEEADARKTLALLEELDDHDDVQKVHSNVDVDADLVEKIQAE